MKDKDIKHLEWVYERMKYVHNENENYDYMVRFREILEALQQPAVSCSFYDFAKNYIRIKDGVNERSFNDKELKQVEEMQQMMDKGYELRLVHLRKGSKIMWCKKNCN